MRARAGPWWSRWRPPGPRPQGGRSSKTVLTNHPGTTEVHLKLVKPGRWVEIRLDPAYRVNATEALFGDLKVLLGPRCLT